MNKSICNFFLFIILLVLAVLFFGCEKKHKYVILKNPIGDTTIIAESNTTYIADDYFDDDDTELILAEIEKVRIYIDGLRKERDSLRTELRRRDSPKPIEWVAPSDAVGYDNTFTVDYSKPPMRVPNTTWIRPYPKEKTTNVYRSPEKVKKDKEIFKRMERDLPYFPTGTQQGVGATYDGHEAISTASWYNGNVLEFYFVIETDDKDLIGVRSGNHWWVEEINDSIKNAQYEYSESAIAEHIKKLKQ